jgi:site-specific DNA-methyltransferase (adenine-specific)
MPVSEVFLEDCMVGMSRYPDKFFDLAVVDPPYGSSIMAKNKFQRHRTTDTSYRNKTIPPPEYFTELRRVSKAQIVWGCQYMMQFMSYDGSFIVWDKKADPDLHNMSSCDIAWYSQRKQIKTFRGHWCGAVKCESEPTIHIHQKPVKLYKWLLKNYAQSGNKILDTHMGSQSSRIAAFNMGFDYWGWEIDQEYFEAGNKRFKEQTAQIKMF